MSQTEIYVWIGAYAFLAIVMIVFWILNRRWDRQSDEFWAQRRQETDQWLKDLEK